MRNKNIIDSWNKIEPDSAAQKRMLDHILTGSDKKRQRRGIPYLKPLATIAAACVVLLGGTFLYNNIDTLGHLANPTAQDGNSNQTDQNPSSVIDPPTSDDVAGLTDEIKGLPVKNFKLSEIEQLMEFDRVAFFNLLNFFEYEADSFVIVKVADTRQVPATDSSREQQISTVKVLETIWGDTVPEAINITQYLYGGCTGDEVTNLMRKDGVYLLPFVEDRGGYYLISDLDVLFEIDDEGHIWSHSDYPDFNRFDGEDYHAVTDEINRITSDDTLMLGSSRFGMAFRGRQLLEVTVLSNRAEEKNEYGYAEVVYTARVEQMLSGEEPEAELTVRSYANEDLPLVNGGRYLLFVDNYDDMHYINSNMMASVEEDGTILNLGNDRSPFSDYNGYTAEQIQELADKVTEYLGTINE